MMIEHGNNGVLPKVDMLLYFMPKRFMQSERSEKLRNHRLYHILSQLFFKYELGRTNVSEDDLGALITYKSFDTLSSPNSSQSGEVPCFQEKAITLDKQFRDSSTTRRLYQSLMQTINRPYYLKRKK